MSNFPVSDPTSFSGGGPDDDGIGSTFDPQSFLAGPRFALLQFRESFYRGTQHDGKRFDIDGRVASAVRDGVLESMQAPFEVPLRSRKPSNPMRMGKKIVESYTALLFTPARMLSLRAEGDSDTEDFANTIITVGHLQLRLAQARNLGGACGSVGMSWCFMNGRPRFDVHNARNLFVHSWEDRTLLIPRHVSEVYIFKKLQWDGKRFAEVPYWYRRDWTPDADFVFEQTPYEQNKTPEWVIDQERSIEHGDGITHFEWFQNLPNAEEIDGFPDYDGLYDNMDTLDLLNSVVSRGGIKNLDPTLVMKMDPDELDRSQGIGKGSDNALVVGLDGDAKYMELAGSSLTTGQAMVQQNRANILEGCHAIIPDPQTVAAQGVSAVAIKMMYAPMTAHADILRGQYGIPIVRMVQNMLKVARASRGIVEGVDANGAPVRLQYAVMLPPRIEETTAVDPVSGESITTIKKVERDPGEAEELTAVWPEYFPLTPQDQTQVMTALQLATGGKAFLSKQDASKITAGAFGLDPAKVWELLDSQSQKDAAAQAEEQKAGMFPAFEEPKPKGGDSEEEPKEPTEPKEEPTE